MFVGEMQGMFTSWDMDMVCRWWPVFCVTAETKCGPGVISSNTISRIFLPPDVKHHDTRPITMSNNCNIQNIFHLRLQTLLISCVTANQMFFIIPNTNVITFYSQIFVIQVSVFLLRYQIFVLCGLKKSYLMLTFN